MASSKLQSTQAHWLYLLNSSKFHFISTLPQTIPFIILGKAEDGNFSCSLHLDYCGKECHFHHPANTGALLKRGQTKGTEQSAHWLLAGAIWAGSNVWLIGQRLLQRQDACNAPRASHTKDTALQRQSALPFFLPQGSQVQPTFTLTREDQRLFFSFGGNYPKICSAKEICFKATGRVPRSWLRYHPQGTAKADTEDQSRGWDSKQHLCHNTYFLKRSVISHGNWKDPWIRNVTKLSLKQKSQRWGESSKLFLGFNLQIQ